MARDLEERGRGGGSLWWKKKGRLNQFDCVCLMNVQGVSFTRNCKKPSSHWDDVN